MNPQNPIEPQPQPQQNLPVPPVPNVQPQPAPVIPEQPKSKKKMIIAIVVAVIVVIGASVLAFILLTGSGGENYTRTTGTEDLSGLIIEYPESYEIDDFETRDAIFEVRGTELLVQPCSNDKDAQGGITLRSLGPIKDLPEEAKTIDVTIAGYKKNISEVYSDLSSDVVVEGADHGKVVSLGVPAIDYFSICDREDLSLALVTYVFDLDETRYVILGITPGVTTDVSTVIVETQDIVKEMANRLVKNN